MTEPALERDYSRPYDRVYTLYPPGYEPPGPGEPGGPAEPGDPGDWNAGGALVPVVWDGLDLDPGWVSGTFTAIVENVEGWYATPPLVGNDTERALADGGAWGLKVIGPREVTITGSAIGPRADIMGWRDRLAGLAAQREPSQLAITDPWLNVTRTAMVRAGTDSFTHEFIGGRRGFRYQVTVTAADPLLYGSAWHTAVLRNISAAESGRPYDRLFTHPRGDHPGPLNGWQYEMPYPPRSAAYLSNAGDAPAPVLAVYEGDLSQSIVTDDDASVIVASMAAGVQVAVDTATLVAEGPGGANRNAMVLPGSRPMFVPAFATSLWHLYSEGSGRVTLTWRDTWL